MSNAVVYHRGGHVYYDPRTGQWVALSTVRILGRFSTKAYAIEAVERETVRTEKEIQDAQRSNP